MPFMEFSVSVLYFTVKGFCCFGFLFCFFKSASLELSVTHGPIGHLSVLGFCLN